MRSVRLKNLPFRLGWRLRVWQGRRRSVDWIQGGLERPDRLQRYSRSVDVRGWVSTPQGRRVKVGAWLGRTKLQDLPLIPSSEGIDLDVSHSRFDAVIPLDAKAAGGWLRILATAEEGSPAMRVLGIAQLVRANPGDALVPRAAYGAVWDAVSSTLSDAQFSVAGTSDAAALSQSGRSTADDVASETGIGPADTVLEIGCGIGRVGKVLSTRCREWIGADVSAEMLRHARTALAGRPNVSFVHLNGVDLEKVRDSSVDVAYCTGVFMHLDEWERFRYFEEAFRVVRPGGRIYVDNINLLSPEGWKLFVQTMRIDPLARPANVSKTSTPDELSWFATQAGFADVRTRFGTLWVTLIARKPAA
jgi:ubiquinone/menaquinone biosynthesis C-methylase UbiE